MNWLTVLSYLEGRRRVRIETSADGKKSTTHFIDPWSEVKDGKLLRYIVHADRRIARLHESTGKPSAVPPVPQGEFVGPREREFLGFLGRLGALFAALWGIALMASGRARLALGLASLRRAFAGIARRPASAAALACVALVASLPVLTACGSDGGKSVPAIEEGTIRQLSEKDTLLFHDQLGSLLTETSGTGKAKARFTAFPYGVARHQSSSESRLYANAPRDTGVGLDHMGARFYAPDLGVWTLGDPVLVNEPERVATAEFATANPYVYANLNPVVAADSDGNFWHIAVGAGVGALIGGGIEAARQYATNGKVEDWVRVGAAAAGGAVAGAVTAAVPTAGVAAIMAMGAGSGAAGGVTQRLVESGGKDAGTLKDVAIDVGVGALTGGLLKGGATLLKKLVPAKPATVPPAPKAASPAASAAPQGPSSPRALPAPGYSAQGFSSQGSLESHFGKHAAEWGAGNITQTGYLKRAQSLCRLVQAVTSCTTREQTATSCGTILARMSSQWVPPTGRFAPFFVRTKVWRIGSCRQASNRCPSHVHAAGI
jgi:RHS repeat-associated protein